MPSADAALSFVRSVRTAEPAPAALEYFDGNALALLREQKRTNPAFKEIPEMKSGLMAALYLEYNGDTDAAVEGAVEAMTERLALAGGEANDTLLASEAKEMERVKFFRHAVPEAVNLAIDGMRKKDGRITKLGTDLAVPDDALEEVMKMYTDDLEKSGLKHVIFGHIGDNHLHVNILPDSMDQYDEGKRMYLKWAKKVVDMGGTVSAEHGIGKMKTAFLKDMYGEEGIGQMRELKKCFDPLGLLSRGNLFAWEGA